MKCCQPVRQIVLVFCFAGMITLASSAARSTAFLLPVSTISAGTFTAIRSVLGYFFGVAWGCFDTEKVYATPQDTSPHKRAGKMLMLNLGISGVSIIASKAYTVAYTEPDSFSHWLIEPGTATVAATVGLLSGGLCNIARHMQTQINP